MLAVARVAGIQAAKRTSDLIPLCHPLLVGSVSVNFEIGDDFVEVEAQVDTVDRTGVEMEALHACAIAALTIYDMCKSADRGDGRSATSRCGRRPAAAPAPTDARVRSTTPTVIRRGDHFARQATSGLEDPGIVACRCRNVVES